MTIARLFPRLLAAVTSGLLIAGTGTVSASAADNPASLDNSAHINFGNDAAAGLTDLRRLLAETPEDTQALALQAIWSDYAGDLITRETALYRLAAIDPRAADGARGVLGAIGAAISTLPNPLPALIGPRTGIVVLGFGLHPDGALRPELVNRLQAAWLQAIVSPAAPIVVTGGNPQNGITEADAMASWLIGHGISATRIHTEQQAGSTVQNALFSTRILRDIGATSAVLVTSPNHIRRAVADFLVSGTRVVGATTSLDQLVSQLPPPSRAEQRGIYLDATRTFLLTSER